ncbi:plant-specific TFIIB-related protein PTF2 [Ananas comosus]|uniref:Plant-specific TFIIB-related protein PTF2 n=1 Tax=Ananas comosus TaxID=4615 RepID=A0A6P5GAF1_ANACO|nr:plant-specific TFIIB-related protein PTF2 [Ananas comosus]
MERTCWSCGEGRVISDPETGARVCNGCGREHEAAADFVQQPDFGPDGRPDASASSLVHSVGDFGYRERKLHGATLLFSSVCSRLGLSPARSDDALRLALSATSGSLATPSSAFLPALAAASARIPDLAARLARRPLPPPSPPFDADRALDRAVRSSPALAALALPPGKADAVVSHARFLLRCAAKWALTTGRHPLPLLAAVIALAAQINGVPSVSVDDVAGEISAGVSTSRARLKELVAALVRAARALLPWGDDVTPRNLAHNAPLLLRLMEMRSKAKPLGPEFFDEFSFDPSELAIAHPGNAADDDEAKYFLLNPGEENENSDVSKYESLKLSGERLLDAHKNAAEKAANLDNAGELAKEAGKKRRRSGGVDAEFWLESWEGGWDSDKKLTLEQILERDVGYDAPPPSFVAGEESRRLRRTKIKAAKRRINETMKGQSSCDDLVVEKDDAPAERTVGRKRRRKSGGGKNGTDWEDCTIELLLLHGVAEEEIEQGHYNRLLDLHVFSPASA